MKKFSKDTFILIDTETTGLEEKDRIVSVSFSYKTPTNNKRIIKDQYCNPGLPISPMASVTTGIRNMDVKDKPVFKNTFTHKMLNKMNDMGAYFVAYNALFDWDMLKKEDIDWNESKVIDMYRVTKHCLIGREINEQKIENFKLQYLRYLYNFDEEPEFLELLNSYGLDFLQPHTSLSDIIVLEYLFEKILEEFKLGTKKMVELSYMPVLEQEITFGKVFEKGTKFKDVVSGTYEQWGKVKKTEDYFNWCLGNMDLLPDTEFSIKYHLVDAILNGDISYYSVQHDKHLNYVLLFLKDKKKIENILHLMEKDSDYLKILPKAYKTKLEQDLKKLDPEKDSWKITSANFYLRYLKNVKNVK